MSDILKQLKDKDSIYRLMFVWGLTAVMLGLAFGWYKILYPISDDSLMAGIIGGTYGTGRAQYVIPFMGVALTYPLAMLSNITGIFNTYGVFLVASVCLVFFAQHYICYRLKSESFCYMLLFILQGVCLMNFTFTVVAFLLMGTGLLWGYALDNGEKNRMTEYVIALIFIFTGISLRANVIYMLLMFAPMIVEQLIGRKGMRFLIFCAFAVCVYCFTEKLNAYVYGSTDIGDYYVKFNLARAFFFDRDVFAYDTYKNIFSESGWTENIYKAFYNRMFLDKQFFGYDVLNELRSKFGMAERYQINIVILMKDFVKNLRKIGLISIYCLAGICVLIIKLKKCKNLLGRIENIAAYLMPYMMFLMLFIRERFLDRVALPFVVFGLLQMILCGQNKGLERYAAKSEGIVKKRQSKLDPILIAVSVFSLLVLLADYAKDDYGMRFINEQETVAVDVYKYVNSHKENLYLNCAYFQDAPYDISVPALEIHKEQFADNLITKRRWDTYSEGYYNTLEKYDLTDKDNLLYSLAMDDNVYLYAPSSGEPEIYKAYMKDAYNLEVELHQEKYFNESNIIYSISVKK